MKHEQRMADVIKIATPSSSTSAEFVAWTPTATYHELADVPVREIDLIESVEQNLAHVEDLQARLSFMMREVKYLMKL